MFLDDDKLQSYRHAGDHSVAISRIQVEHISHIFVAAKQEGIQVVDAHNECTTVEFVFPFRLSARSGDSPTYLQVFAAGAVSRPSGTPAVAIVTVTHTLHSVTTFATSNI